MKIRVHIPAIMLIAAFMWLVIALWFPPALILFWICMVIAIAQIIVGIDIQ